VRRIKGVAKKNPYGGRLRRKYKRNLAKGGGRKGKKKGNRNGLKRADKKEGCGERIK
jgi:hypothetical protein